MNCISQSEQLKPKRSRLALLASCLGAAMVLLPGPALADYWVYCIHSKIRIESRPPADVGRSHISSSMCTLGSFRHVGDARSFAQRNWRGEGQSCACR